MAGLLSPSLRNSRPNFVLFNVDDTGFGDWSWNKHGASSEDDDDDTPRTSALVCTPSACTPSSLVPFRAWLCGASHAESAPTCSPCALPPHAVPHRWFAAGARSSAHRLPRRILGVHADEHTCPLRVCICKRIAIAQVRRLERSKGAGSKGPVSG